MSRQKKSVKVFGAKKFEQELLNNSFFQKLFEESGNLAQSDLRKKFIQIAEACFDKGEASIPESEEGKIFRSFLDLSKKDPDAFQKAWEMLTKAEYLASQKSPQKEEISGLKESMWALKKEYENFSREHGGKNTSGFNIASFILEKINSITPWPPLPIEAKGEAKKIEKSKEKLESTVAISPVSMVTLVEMAGAQKKDAEQASIFAATLKEEKKPLADQIRPIYILLSPLIPQNWDSKKINEQLQAVADNKIFTEAFLDKDGKINRFAPRLNGSEQTDIFKLLEEQIMKFDQSITPLKLLQLLEFQRQFAIFATAKGSIYSNIIFTSEPTEEDALKVKKNAEVFMENSKGKIASLTQLQAVVCKSLPENIQEALKKELDFVAKPLDENILQATWRRYNLEKQLSENELAKLEQTINASSPNVVAAWNQPKGGALMQVIRQVDDFIIFQKKSIASFKDFFQEKMGFVPELKELENILKRAEEYHKLLKDQIGHGLDREKQFEQSKVSGITSPKLPTKPEKVLTTTEKH
jgi:hypothetical protein